MWPVLSRFPQNYDTTSIFLLFSFHTTKSKLCHCKFCCLIPLRPSFLVFWISTSKYLFHKHEIRHKHRWCCFVFVHNTYTYSSTHLPLFWSIEWTREPMDVIARMASLDCTNSNVIETNSLKTKVYYLHIHQSNINFQRLQTSVLEPQFVSLNYKYKNVKIFFE